MTPEAHARLLLDFLTQRGEYDQVVAAVYDDDAAVAAVRDYFRQVILEEREACAQLIERHSQSLVAEWGLQGLMLTRVRSDLAAAIRAGSTPSSVGRADSVGSGSDPQGAADPPV